MAEEFKDFLLQGLLTDSWGGWRDLDTDFLDQICEKAEHLADNYVNEKSEIFTCIKEAANTSEDTLFEMFQERDESWQQLWKEQPGP